MSMLIDAYRFATAPALSLYDEIMSDNPFMYLRLGEASGTNANNENGATDGTFSGTHTLGNTALYSGGPTCFRVTGTDGRCAWPGASIPSLTQLTLGVIYKPSSSSGIRHIFTIDQDSGGSRRFQFRYVGTNLDWIKIVGGVESVPRTNGMSVGTAYLLNVTITTGGLVKLFVNGSQIGSNATIGAVDYGGSSATDLVIGNRGTHNEGQSTDEFSEAYAIATAISDARILAHAQAAGFA